MKEIEILFFLKEPIVLAKKKIGKVDWKIVSVTDTYFKSEDHSRLSPGDDFRLTASLRLRDKGKKYHLTYKNDYFDQAGAWLYSDEHEIEISDIKTFHAILTALHYKELIAVKNKKHLCRVDGYEIALEEVKGLGNFIEIEYCEKKAIRKNKIEALKEVMRQYLRGKQIKFGEELNAGKPELILRKQKESHNNASSSAHSHGAKMEI